MDLWNASTAGVVIGGGIAALTQLGTQISANWRADKQQSRKALQQSKAEHDALQIRTIADLQEQLEAVSLMMVGEAGRPVKATVLQRLFAADDHDVTDLTPLSRSLMLCSRLDDQELATEVRTWLKDVRVVLSQSPLNSKSLFALRDRRIEFQDRLGTRLLSLHGHGHTKKKGYSLVSTPGRNMLPGRKPAKVGL